MSNGQGSTQKKKKSQRISVKQTHFNKSDNSKYERNKKKESNPAV